MSESFDLVIIGGGPAGTALALALKKRHPDLSIALIEASLYRKWRVGETLSPEAGRAFRELGIWESFEKSGHVAAMGTAAAWENEELHENEFIFYPEGKGWHLDRVKFDRWMANQAVLQGVTLYTDTRYLGHEVNKDNTFLLRLRHGMKEFCLNAGFVADASGRSAVFSKQLGVGRQVYDRLSGCIGVFETKPEEQTTRAYTLVEAVEDGWWYAGALPDGKTVAAFMTDADILKVKRLKDSAVFMASLDQTKHIRERITHLNPSGQLTIRSAASICSDRVAGHNWVAVGDAASTFDPLSSQGIYKSIRSGIFGAYAVSDALGGNLKGLEKYERYIKEEYQEYLATRNVFYKKVKRWPDSLFWSGRQLEKSTQVQQSNSVLL